MLGICTQVLGNFPIYLVDQRLDSLEAEQALKVPTQRIRFRQTPSTEGKQSGVARGRNNSSEKSTTILLKAECWEPLG